MKHPLSSFGSYDFEGVADFSLSSIVNDNSDFGSEFDGEYQLGDYDEGLGRKFKFKKPKIKFKKPASYLKSAAHLDAVKKLNATKLVSKQLAQIKKIAAQAPLAKQVQQLAKKAETIAAKSGINSAKITSMIKIGSSGSKKSSSSEVEQTIDTPEVIATQSQTPVEQQVVNTPSMVYSYSHPMLKVNRKLSGKTEGLSGFFDDLYNAQKKIVQNVIDTQKTKAIQAATTQATNLVGKQLTNLSKTNPDAQKAIAQVVSTATAAAQDTALEKAKAMFEQNKKYIYAAGGVALGLVALKLFMNKKA